jgi:S1-C subfamily serine protease
MADELRAGQAPSEATQVAAALPETPQEPAPRLLLRALPSGPPAGHPLASSTAATEVVDDEAARIRLAWAKLVWLLALLAALLAVSYLVPYIAEQTQYALTRGRQRAEYDFAQAHLGQSPLHALSRGSQMISQIVGPSVVHISTLGSESSELALPTFRARPRVPTEGQGSGVIVEADGYILTNNHVIRGASEILVSLADGRKVPARVVGRDARTDLAVLKIDADQLTPATWGDSEAVEPGALVWAVGSPFGLERSVTSGILSGKHRSGLAGNPQQDFLQTDAAVNPGNSGGPLVDVSGRVIGINTAIVGEAYQGISFAIPSNVAREVYARLKAEGAIRRGWLGVQLEEMTAAHARRVGLPAPAGVYIAGIFMQDGPSPAARAGIQPGDVLLRWGDTEVSSPLDLRTLVEKTAIGRRTPVLIYREGRELTLEVIVGERPQHLD